MSIITGVWGLFATRIATPQFGATPVLLPVP